MVWKTHLIRIPFSLCFLVLLHVLQAVFYVWSGSEYLFVSPFFVTVYLCNYLEVLQLEVLQVS